MAASLTPFPGMGRTMLAGLRVSVIFLWLTHIHLPLVTMAERIWMPGWHIGLSPPAANSGDTSGGKEVPVFGSAGPKAPLHLFLAHQLFAGRAGRSTLSYGPTNTLSSHRIALFWVCWNVSGSHLLVSWLPICCPEIFIYYMPESKRFHHREILIAGTHSLHIFFFSSFFCFASGNFQSL